MSNLSEITYVGDEEYHSTDPWATNPAQPVILNPGESAKVSAEKAEQVEADFPHLFKIDGKGPTKKSRSKAAGDDPDA